MNLRTHEAWKRIFIRDQWLYRELRDEFKIAAYRALDNDSAHVECVGA